MKNQNAKQTTWQELAASNDFNQLPPNGPGITNSEPPERKPTLTQTFNAVAKPDLSTPVSKMQIEALRKKMSQPKATLEMSPLGSVNKARNPKADRRIQKTITALTEQLSKQKGLKERFALADQKNRLKTTFNRAANERGM